jgi:hypothetical protein
MSDNCDDTNFLAMKGLKYSGGTEAVKSMVAGCHAAEEGHLGYATLMALKAEFHDIPVHQFSPGDTPKPVETPPVKNTDKTTKVK